MPVGIVIVAEIPWLLMNGSAFGGGCMHTASHEAAGGALLAALVIWLMNQPYGSSAKLQEQPAALHQQW